MVSIPGFLLRRLYVKGSLRNTEAGFQFTLKNSLGSGYARKMFPLTVDGQELPLESVTFALDDQEAAFSQVSEERPFTLAMNRSITIRASGQRLSPGPHKIGMSFEVPGLGRLRFDFTDALADG